MAKIQNLDVILTARDEIVAYDSVADDSRSVTLTISDLYEVANDAYIMRTPSTLKSTLDSMTVEGFTPEHVSFNPFQRVKAKRILDKDKGTEDLHKSIVKTAFSEPQLYTRFTTDTDLYVEVYTTAKYTQVKQYKRKGNIEDRTVIVGYDFSFRTLIRGVKDDSSDDEIIMQNVNGIAINSKGGFPSLSWGFRQAYKACKDELVHALQDFGLSHNQYFLKLKVGIGSRFEVVGG